MALHCPRSGIQAVENRSRRSGDAIGDSEGLSVVSPDLSGVAHKGPISTGDATHGLGHAPMKTTKIFGSWAESGKHPSGCNPNPLIHKELMGAPGQC